MRGAEKTASSENVYRVDIETQGTQNAPVRHKIHEKFGNIRKRAYHTMKHGGVLRSEMIFAAEGGEWVVSSTTPERVTSVPTVHEKTRARNQSGSCGDEQIC
jgi:hypothetical protein